MYTRYRLLLVETISFGLAYFAVGTLLDRYAAPTVTEPLTTIVAGAAGLGAALLAWRVTTHIHKSRR
jgi:multisubunit Na+/H+ antiporter MnhB subunit